MIKNKDKHVKGRIITSILWKYIIFSIVFLAFLIFLLFTATWNSSEYKDIPQIKEVAEAFAHTQPESYKDVDIEGILGENSYVQILDKENQIVYCSSETHVNEQYSDYEMNIISDDRNYTIISEDNYTREDGTKDTVITVMGMDEWGNTTKEDIYIVDQNLNLLYSTVFESKKELTEKEFNLLMSYRSGGSGLIKSKCSFTDTEGQEMMLIVTSPKNTENTFRRSRTAFLTNTVTFVILYLLMVVLFSFWISMRVNKPLKMLNSAMNEIGTGKKGTMLHYEGPREFVEICDNFNRMSTALYESEQENLKLQGEKQKMIADISHDLKTPITVIKGYSKAVRDGLAAPEDIGRYLETIYNRSEELTYLIEEFHEYAKMEHPDNAFVFEETDICEYTRTYFAGKYSEFELRGFHLEIDIPEEPVMVSLDEKKFRRIYDNITGNFFRYNVQGSTFFCRVSFDTAEPSEEQYVLITLSDNGEGIPLEIRSTIFEPFIVGEKARNKRGSGLGLPIARKIAERHGGSLTLENLPSQGISTEFKLYVPRK